VKLGGRMTNTNRTIRRSLLAICVISGCCGAVAAQDTSERTAQPFIRVMGDAAVTVKPDQAEINIGVLTIAQTAQAAANQNAQKQDAVIAELRKALGAGADIKTIGYSISPNYRYPKEGGQPTIIGYTASNVVHVKTTNLAQIGKVIDAATATGANTIQSLRFTLKDEAAAREQALGEASKKARAKAEAIASALGLKVQRILRVEEGASPIRPMMEMDAIALRAQAPASTPIESGSIDVRATVTLTVEIGR
jgi:uncharacterized protein